MGLYPFINLVSLPTALFLTNPCVAAKMSHNERRTDDVAVLDAAAASWRGFCMRKRRDNRQWRKFGVKRRTNYST